MTSTTFGRLKLEPPPYRPVTALQCYLAYGSALLLGIATWWVLQSRQVIENPLWIGLVASCVCTVVIWIFSIANDNSSIYDPLAAEDQARGPAALIGAQGRFMIVPQCFSPCTRARGRLRAETGCPGGPRGS
jgi:hypothetical protein